MAPSKLRILVVDRDISVAETLVMVLHAGGFDAVAVFTGEEAIASAEQCEFDILLTDVMMESMNGVQIALAVLALRPSIRVILFSGSDRASPILVAATESGHNFPVLAKPLHPTELLSHLRDDGSS